ncbi:MAG: transcription elongation factor GreA [Streptosporangiaceae bacterium]
MTETQGNVTWLTQEAYDRLKTELDYLSGQGRTEIAKRIEAARDEGDLKENGGYHAAKEEQGLQEARIRHLQQLLENAKVGKPPPADGVVEPGMKVTIRFQDDGDSLTFLLGSREDTGLDIDVYSAQSPLGTAINGKKVGDTAAYDLPNGREQAVEITEAIPYAG